jgi:hypothetical protein
LGGETSIHFPERQQLPPQFETAGIVHPENLHGRASRGGQSLNTRPSQRKVIGPKVAAWMKQESNLTRNWVDPRQIRPLMKIATMTGQRQIARVVGPAMLFRYDVFDMVD